MTESFDPRRTYEVWEQLISDEELYRSMLAGTHGQLAASRRLEPTDLAILDFFRAQPGIRWNVDNLRFRAAIETVGKLKMWIPRTAILLCQGNDEWLQDVCYEYMAYHRWIDLGHYHFAECRRFFDYARERILVRRRPPDHIEAAMAFEGQIVDLLERTASIPGEAWPPRREVDEKMVEEGRPRRSPASVLFTLPEDIGDWIKSADPRQGEVREGEIAVFSFVPSLAETHKIQILQEGSRFVLEQCDGARTGVEIAEGCAEQDMDPNDVIGLLERWVRARALALE